MHLLRAAGHKVTVADVGCCGRTMMSTGMLEQARRSAARALAGLHAHVRAGRTIAFIEPSCISMVCDDWKRLLPDDPRVDEVAAASRFGLDLVAEAAAGGRLRFRPGGAALLHPHCHERSLFTSAATEAALRAVPDLRAHRSRRRLLRHERRLRLRGRPLRPQRRHRRPRPAAGRARRRRRHGRAGHRHLLPHPDRRPLGRAAEHPAVFLAERLST